MFYKGGCVDNSDFFFFNLLAVKVDRMEGEMKRVMLGKWMILGGVMVSCLVGCVTEKAEEDAVEKGLHSLAVIGQAEYVTVLPQNYRYKARIDTGATTCSISALKIEPFERDGEKWVRFCLPLPGSSSDENPKLSEPLEYPITREVNIKRHGAPDQIRPAVKLRVRLGSFEGLVEFTLTDRTKYEYPVLVGRNLLEGHAVVDVSKSYVAEENK